jgi:predicted 2-oxoglutarate/Fe(II)-dependent dioxygenase YbiX
MGCVVNIHRGQSSVQTMIHRDVRKRPFVPSCLCPIGDFTGGALILWKLHAVVELKPGDLFFFPDSLIHHSNEAVIGMCHSVVAFIQQNMFDY